MADISQVKLPNGDTYNLVDETSGYIKNYTETDPVFSASAAAGITATDISNWNGKSDTDEKLKVTVTNTSGVYYPVLSTDVTTTETKKYDEFFNFCRVNGTNAYLGIGKLNTALGQIRLYTAELGGRYGIITPGTLSTTRTYTLPDATGTVALTSDIPTVPTKTSDLTNDSNFAAKSTTTVTLTTTWSSKTQTISVTGVTASNTVIITPTPASYNAYCEYGVYCSAQSSGTLTFTCDEVPTSSLTVNVLILN